MDIDAIVTGEKRGITRETAELVANRLLVVLCCFLSGCASPPEKTASIDDAQLALYPTRYQHRVGDLILSLPVGYYESAPHRLAYARQILESARPMPAEAQDRYLRVAADGLAPERHFLLLDQNHLLVFSEPQALEGGHPAELEVLERRNDVQWIDVTEEHLPTWTHAPSQVTFREDGRRFEVLAAGGRERALFRWSGHTLVRVASR